MKQPTADKILKVLRQMLNTEDYVYIVNLIESLVNEEEQACKWHYDEMCDFWEGECGIAWSLIDGVPIENDMLFCPKCGKKLLDQED